MQPLIRQSRFGVALIALMLLGACTGGLCGSADDERVALEDTQPETQSSSPTPTPTSGDDPGNGDEPPGAVFLYRDDGRFNPDLVRSATTDGRFVTITLQEGLKTQDGEPFTLSATVERLDQVLIERTGPIPELRSVEFVDDVTLRFEYEGPIGETVPDDLVKFLAGFEVQVVAPERSRLDLN